MLGEIKLEFLAGTELSSACKQAIRITQKLKRKVSFRFNGVELTVTKDDDIESLYNLYETELKEN